MTKSIKRIGLVIALAALTTISVAAARYQNGDQGLLRLDSNNNCVCTSPGESNGPPCGGECQLNLRGRK
jgi:hypothetical protein